jgi:hypothetical protein
VLEEAIVHRVLILGAVAAVLLLAGAPSLLRKASDLREALPALVDTKKTAAPQSAAQLSSAEFAALASGLSRGSLRSQVGAPDDRSTARVEGVKIECWYYGVAEASGAYQLCFANGRLTSKLRYSEGRAGSLDWSSQ